MKPIKRKNNDSSKISIASTKQIQKNSKSDLKLIVNDNGLPINSMKNINWLPNDLIVDILADVAATSISDFFNAKLSWKLFNKLAKDNDEYIHNKLSLDELSCHPWDLYLCKEAIALFMKCLHSQNLEAMYRQGVIDYLNFHQKKESSLELLKKAANAGHLGASYFMGIIYICKEDHHKSDDESEQSCTKLGLQLLGNIKTSAQMLECRKKLKEIANSLWLTQNHDFLIPKLFECQFPERKRRLWPCLDDDLLLCCHTCRLNNEITFVCNLMAGCSIFSYQTCYQ
ncbi:hypothetical protein CsatB_019155 [Cannabis sativa]